MYSKNTYEDKCMQQYSKSIPTHDRGKAESKAQSQGYLAGHAAPVLRLSKEDDGAEEGHQQWEEQRETQQSIIGFHQRGANVHNKHHLKGRIVKHTIWCFSSLLSTTRDMLASPGGMFSLRGSHRNSNGEKSSDGWDDDESDPQWLSKGQELNDFWYTGIMSIIGPVVFTAQDTFASICQRVRGR